MRAADKLQSYRRPTLLIPYHLNEQISSYENINAATSHSNFDVGHDCPEFLEREKGMWGGRSEGGREIGGMEGDGGDGGRRGGEEEGARGRKDTEGKGQSLLQLAAMLKYR